MPFEHVPVLLASLVLCGAFFSQLGVLAGIRAEQWDDISFIQQFVLTPLIFLGGVFYSASLLPSPFDTITRFNPVFHMIELVRYGFLGITDTHVSASLAVLALVTAGMFALNLRLVTTGWRLRA
jgi:ABC-2 type transport system permease protein